MGVLGLGSQSKKKKKERTCFLRFFFFLKKKNKTKQKLIEYIFKYNYSKECFRTKRTEKKKSVRFTTDNAKSSILRDFFPCLPL